MKPSLNVTLGDISKKLMEDIAPALDSDYKIRSVYIMANMLMTGVIEYEHGAEIRVQENKEMQELFATAVEVVENPELKEQLEKAANIHDTSLKISALDALNAELKEVLIALHAYVEEVDKPWANELVERIWSHLDTSATRRREIFPGFA